LLLLGFAAVPLHAQELKAEEQQAIDRLTELLGQAQPSAQRFSQLTLDGSGTQLQETAGSMAGAPRLFRWHTDAPMEQLLVSNGE
jgi:outer membrane lipoprotein carrier protein